VEAVGTISTKISDVSPCGAYFWLSISKNRHKSQWSACGIASGSSWGRSRLADSLKIIQGEEKGSDQIYVSLGIERSYQFGPELLNFEKGPRIASLTLFEWTGQRYFGREVNCTGVLPQEIRVDRYCINCSRRARKFPHSYL
jgi:hypothetical protein